MKKVIPRQTYNFIEEIPVNHINSSNYFVRVNSNGIPQAIITEIGENDGTYELVLLTFTPIKHGMNIEGYLAALVSTGVTIYAFDTYIEAFQFIIDKEKKQDALRT